MALPTTNISVTLVKNAISESTTDVGGLVTSLSVNVWGINSPDGAQQNRCWGVLNQASPYQLGMFRGYDHTWRCWALEEIAQNSSDFLDPISASLILRGFPGWSIADSAIHTFDILFKRTSNFEQGGYTTLSANMTMQNLYEYQFTFSTTSPPDGGAALTAGQVVYIAVVHKSSPVRKWDDNRSATPYEYQIGTNNTWIKAITVPSDPYTYNLSIYDEQSYMTIINPSDKYLTSSLTLRIDTRTDQTVSCESQYSKNSDFAVEVQSLSDTQVVTKNSTGGSPELRDFTMQSAPSNYFAVGDTVYYRSRISYSYSDPVNYTTNWTATKSLVVSALLPS